MSEAGSGPAGSHLDDERLSALVDGVAPPDDEVHAASCSDCGARLAAWKEVTARLAGLGTQPPTEVVDSRRDEIVLTALAAGRRGRFARPYRWLAAAAAVLVVGGALAAGLTQVGGGGTPHQASSAAPTAAPPGGAAPASTSPGPSTSRSPSTSPGLETGGAAPPAAAASPAAGGLGDVAGPAALVQALQARFGATAATQSRAAPATPVGPCVNQARTDASAGPSAAPQQVAGLTYASAPAEVYVFSVDSLRVAVVEGAAGCTLLARTTF